MVFEGSAGVHEEESFSWDVEQGGMHANVYAPAVSQPHLILSIEVQLLCLHVMSAVGIHGVHRQILATGKLVSALCLWTEVVPGEIAAETDMVTYCRTVVEVGPQGGIVDGGTVLPFDMVDRHSSFLPITPVFEVLVDTAVMGVSGTEVGKEVWFQLVVPVKGHAQVSP